MRRAVSGVGQVKQVTGSRCNERRRRENDQRAVCRSLMEPTDGRSRKKIAAAAALVLEQHAQTWWRRYAPSIFGRGVEGRARDTPFASSRVGNGERVPSSQRALEER